MKTLTPSERLEEIARAIRGNGELQRRLLNRLMGATSWMVDPENFNLESNARGLWLVENFERNIKDIKP